MAGPRGKAQDTYTDLYNVYKGQIHMKNGRVVYPVDVTGVRKDLDAITDKLGISRAEAVREAIRNYAETVRGLEVVTYRKVTKKQAVEEVRRYLKGKKRVASDEISDALQLDMGTVDEALTQLWKEGWVEPM